MTRYVVLKDGTELGRFAGKREAQTIGASAYRGGRKITIQDLQAKDNHKTKIWQFDPAGGYFPIAN